MRRVCFAALLFTLATASARADVTYNYTGSYFAFAPAPYTTSDHVTGSFTLASALAPNLQNVSFTPLSFSLTDGVQTISSALDPAAFVQFAEFSTNSAGSITSYYVFVSPSPQSHDDINLNGSMSIGYMDFAASNHTLAYTDPYARQANGVFTVAATPEPSSLAMLGTGITALGALLRRRRQS